MAAIGKPNEVEQYQQTSKNTSGELVEGRSWSRNELTKLGEWKGQESRTTMGWNR
jgi:hypothetical protein